MKTIILLVAFQISFSLGISAQGNLAAMDMLKLEESILASNKIKVNAKAEAIMPAYNNLLAVANKLLDFKPVSVMEKTEVPPSGDKHDYMSLAPYWWPNPATADGLPYIRKDGETNPEVRNYPDKNNLPKLCENIYILSLAYYYSGDEKYAAHAAKLTRVWFLDPETRMNPNLNFGQSVKGVTSGRGAGLIDTRHLIFVTDAMGILSRSANWTTKDQTAIKKWYADFLSWMENSKIGQEELNAKNNHGVWYDAQRMSYALFSGDKKKAEKIIQHAVELLDTECAADGSFPHELQRTMSLHYSVFVMNAYFVIAQQAEKLGMNLWTMRTKSGKSLQKSFDYLRPYITQQKEWTGQQIKKYDFQSTYPLLWRGRVKYDCKECLDAVKKTAGNSYDLLLLHLL